MTKQFCPQGHDTFVVGRTKTSHCRTCHNFYTSKNRPATARKSHLKFKYGITPEEYDNLFSMQKGCCAICSKHQSLFVRRLATDHNHKTGKVRGLLCHQCNIRLGMLEDSLFVVNAQNYLKGAY